MFVLFVLLGRYTPKFSLDNLTEQDMKTHPLGSQI